MVKTVRLNWLAIAQLMLSVFLLTGGAWLLLDGHYQQEVVNSSGTLTPHTVRSTPTVAYNLPAGGRTIFPKHRLVALYGSPGAPVLGSLGQQNLQASIRRVRALAKQYQPHMQERTLPTFEIIATVASATPTNNNDYSREISVKTLGEWVTAARLAGVYVVLDLQPGRADFLSQAKKLLPLLKQPNVGLALDPEWRLKPNQKPLVQIGAVSIQEVNATAGWLADVTRRNNLPQKLFLLHQFRNDMLPGRHLLNTSHKELAYAIQMDGQGSQPQKQDTWHAILRESPPNTRFGWKNFYVKDPVLLTPAQTMGVRPKPWYVSYQ